MCNSLTQKRIHIKSNLKERKGSSSVIEFLKYLIILSLWDHLGNRKADSLNTQSLWPITARTPPIRGTPRSSSFLSEPHSPHGPNIIAQTKPDKVLLWRRRKKGDEKGRQGGRWRRNWNLTNQKLYSSE